MSLNSYGQVYYADGTSISALGTTNSTGIYLRDHVKVDNLSVHVNVTTLTGTAPTLTVSVQWSNDNVTFSDPQAGADAFTAIAATGATNKTFPVKGKWFRLKYVAGGTAVTSIVFTASAFGN